MKISEAQQIYRGNRKMLIEQRRALIRQREDLSKRTPGTEEEKKIFAEEAATLELSINEVNKKFDKNQEILDKLTEQYAAVWNAEVSRQQGDAMQDEAIELGKIMTVFRRIANGAIVPGKDEQKLMEYSMEMYMAAKNLASMKEAAKREKYDSLWEEDQKEEEEYDPQGKAENAEAGVELPDISVEEIPNITV